MMDVRRSQVHRTVILVISVCLISFTAQAQYGGGTGEPNDPYRIATVEQLALMGDVIARFQTHFVLVEDIYLDPNLPFDGPIIAHFSGVFDGNDHIISNLTIESRWPSAGLFGELHVGAVVTDLGIVDVNITTLYHDGYVGGMVGQNGGSISSCYVTGTVDGDEGNIGGLVGSNSGNIVECWSDDTVAEGRRNVGGLVGSNSGNVVECWSDGTVRELSPFQVTVWGPVTLPGIGVGGLVGVNYGDITDCFSSCDVKSSYVKPYFQDSHVEGYIAVGGLVGVNCGTIENGQASGSVEGLENIGGLVGSNGTSRYEWGESAADSRTVFSGGSILNCHATGKVTGKATDFAKCTSIGGLVGYSQGDMIDMSYALGDVTGGDDSTSIGGLVGSNWGKYYDRFRGLVVSNNGGDVVNSYARGAVYGNDELGGLIGSNSGQIKNCYATGKVIPSSNPLYSDLGGLVGRNGGPWLNSTGGSIEQCYYLDPNSYYYWQSTVDSLNNGLGEPLTIVQMKERDSFKGWDFVDEIENGTENIWWILEGQDYPRLWWEPEPNDPNAPVIPDDAFVDINDPGIQGHEGFTGEMCKYEITNAQYCQYLNAALSDGLIVDYNDLVFDVNDTDHARPYFVICNDPNEKYSSQIAYNQGLFTVRNRIRYNTAEHPVVEVSWYGATAFCDYYGYRLPTEWEWQAVADYDGSYIYGCGTGIADVIANYGFFPGPGLSGRWYNTHTSPVGHYSSFGYGMCDMAGNVWEWTSSISENSGVIRGGSWRSGPFDCMVGSSAHPNLDTTGNEVGFRVCR